MARANKPEDTVVVAKLPPRKPKGGIAVKVGKPRKIMTAALRRTAAPLTGGTTTGSGGNFYSPELSTDFLELPQSIDEQRSYYRHFYNYDPFVGQALDQHEELPLSKLRLNKPKAKNKELADKAMRFCEKWAKRIKLLHRLISIVHEYFLLGEAWIYCEDTSPDLPNEVRCKMYREITADGGLIEKWEEYADADEREVEWLKKNYKGWTAVRCLPPEQIHMESFGFTDAKIIELVPDAKTRALINRADQGDPQAQRVAATITPEIVEAIRGGRNIPLNTDPDAGSFVHYLARKKSDYEENGKSLLQRCLLPGTQMWVKRDGVIQQVNVEDVVNTDLALTHKGRFQPLVSGSRRTDELVTTIEIEGIQNPLRLTADHRILRVQEDGSEEWVEAQEIKSGDLLREAHVVPNGEVAVEVDMASWWMGRQVQVNKRRGDTRDLSVENVNRVGNVLEVTFSYENDNRNRAQAINGMSRILAWAHDLIDPVVKTQAEVAEEAGVSERDVRVYAPRLRKEGLLHTDAKSLGRGRGQEVTWFPSERKELPRIFTTRTTAVTKIPITERFCYLLGTWLGDGCVWTDEGSLLNTHSVGWSLHDPEMEQRVVGLINEFFGSPLIERGSLIGLSEGTQDLRIEDPLLARWFMGEFGHGAQGKHLPEWVFNFPEEHLLSLLRGVLDTDGWVSKKGTSLSIELKNEVLVSQLHLLCSRLGIQTQVRRTKQPPKTWIRRWKTNQGVSEKTYQYGERFYWSLSCCRSLDVSRWTNGALKSPILGDSQHKYTWASRFNEGWLTRKVGRVKTKRYQGVVYSFDVAEDESHVTSVVTHNCLHMLVFRDKVRQALTSIASRHMTPYRLVYAEDMNEEQTEELREQVDMALMDPDYSIITNFQVNWEEIGADQRLPDWSWVWDFTDRQMYAGLGTTESMLSGESSYSGDRINLEVVNTRYMLLREMLQDLVEEHFFKPMCKRMGFIEEDEDGDMIVITPRLSFTRLALRDSSDTFDQLYNLYIKGSLSIDTIYDVLNLDVETETEKIKNEMLTAKDSTFNEALRSALSSAGNSVAEQSDLVEKLCEVMGLKYIPPAEEEGGRF